MFVEDKVCLYQTYQRNKKIKRWLGIPIYKLIGFFSFFMFLTYQRFFCNLCFFGLRYFFENILVSFSSLQVRYTKITLCGPPVQLLHSGFHSRHLSQYLRIIGKRPLEWLFQYYRKIRIVLAYFSTEDFRRTGTIKRVLVLSTRFFVLEKILPKKY